MTATLSPLEALADELGAFASRLERELKLSVASALAELRASRAEAELQIERAVTERLASLQDGPQGPQGEPGARGEPGEGIQGPPGEPGVPGPPGRFLAPTIWAKGIHYGGAIVRHGGSTWCAARDTAEEPPHVDWVCVAEAGRAGRSIAIRGLWNAAEQYRALDVVALNGSSFVARTDEPGHCPGDGWQLIAAQGNRGKAGEKGPKGDRGPALVAAAVDAEGLLTLTADDGSTITCDFYPVLSRMAR